MADIQQADRLVFPGVGAFEQAMGRLKSLGYNQPLKEYVQVRTGCSAEYASSQQSTKRSCCCRLAGRSWASAWACTCCTRAATRTVAWRDSASSLAE